MNGTDFVAIDLETTGLFPRRDRVIEIGLVKFNSSFEIVDQFETLVNPLRDLGPTHVHEITASMVMSAPTIADVMPEVADFVNGTVLVAHNKTFDLSFLREECRKLAIEHSELDALCTIELIRAFMPQAPRRLVDICNLLDIPVENAHHALSDAHMTASVAIRILRDYGYPAIPEPTYINISSQTGESRKVERSSSSLQVANPYLERLENVRTNEDPEPKIPSTMVSEYLNLLDRALEDRIFDTEEVELLIDFLETHEVHQLTVKTMHSIYLADLVKSYLRNDGVITQSEYRDLKNVAQILGVDDLDDMISFASTADLASHESFRAIPAGSSVCFTGTMETTRDECSRLATAKGLVVVTGVTKTLDVLVVADPHTQSGKAQKARKYGTRIIAEKAFFREIESYPESR